ncbi:MAG: hypothetical protein KC431_24630, partial [Myxococcales bacterium]|nr:hypothetical protein [Myxococcales bacterium]
SAGEADALRLSLRSRHSDASWASTGKALRDRLRERQRRALVAYLLANGDGEVSFADENDLYAHYLLDVEMSACATTSRIKLALSSIQLFIQRVFLNLEAPIEFDADAAVQYRWMKNYRVWEANRKVFLYPENFVEPELRSDKSPLYAALEAALAQDEASEKLTERAFLDYLGGLESIAKPEVMGLVREREGQGVDRLHVLARTRGKPHRWLYRTREYRRFWTPWVELPVEIEGDHALPVIYNGRLYILWPSFRLIADQITSVESGGDTIGQAGAGVLQIGLNWMERRFDEWGPTRSCPGFFVAEQTFHEWEVRLFKTELRLATREVKNVATGQPALEVTARKSTFNAMSQKDTVLGYEAFVKQDYLNLGRFVLEASQDDVLAQSIAEIEDSSELPTWRYEFNHHVNVGQSLWSDSDRPTSLRLETQEARWPQREQSVTLFSAPPMGYRLILPQDERAGLVRDTGFFYQDRWRSLFLQPRDMHLGGNCTPSDADPGDIEAAPFLQLGGLKQDAPQVDLARKTPSPEQGLLVHDQLQIKPQWYAGDGGVFNPQKVAKGGWAPTQIEALTSAEKDLATKIYNTPASKQAPRSSLPWQGKRFSAQIFEHPYAERFVGQVRAYGVEGLLSPTDEQDPSGTLARQLLDDEVFSAERYDPNKIDPPWPRADVDFSPGGSYSVYNWELFFHAPLLLAKRLSSSQRFEEADDWLRKIFDPTASAGDAPARYWKIRPFFESAQPPDIHELLLLLHYDGSDEEILAAREAFEHQIWQWRRNPFDPHLIAGLRDGAYQRAVVMAYLDNLIAWGDSLFARDTIESINEAT